TASSLVDDRAMVVATLVDGPDLGRFVMVVSEGEFRRLASHDVVDGREYLTAAFALHAGGESRWAPFLVPREKLAERFGIAAAPAPSAPPPHEWGGPTVVDRRQEGFLGGAEGEWLVLELEPGSEAHRRLDGYRIPLSRLGDAVAKVCSGV